MTIKIVVIGAVAAASLTGLSWDAAVKRFGSLEILRSEPVSHAVCTTGLRAVSARALRVRSQPPDGTVVGGLTQGARVTVTRCTGPWAEIGLERWVNAIYLSPAAPPAVRAAHCNAGPHYVDADGLNVRARPTDGEVLGLITRGEYVPVFRCEGAWAEIGKGRWVHAGYLTTVKPERPRPELAARAPEAN